MSCRRCCLALFVLIAPILDCGVIAAEVEAFTEPYQEVELAIGESGILDELRVREGERVKESQVVARLDTRVLQASLRIAQLRAQSMGALDAAMAELELRKNHRDQLRVLRKKGHASQRELDRAEADFRIADARRKMAEEEILLQKLECQRIQAQIDRRVLRTPIDGVVSEISGDVGESFSGTERYIMKIVKLNKLRAKFSLSPAEASDLSPGDYVNVRLTQPASVVQARIETILPVMDAKSGTLAVMVVVDNEAERLRSGGRCFLQILEHATSTRFTRD
ncbi:MAG: hypothetical protein CMJ77_08745 [Planctomycetaceae bacterium]|nr:hypothetical protein [Planctomycetaceae bacterium]